MVQSDQKPVSPEEVRDQISMEIGISRVDLKSAPRLLSDVMDEVAPQGIKTKLSEWEDKDIVLHSIRFFKGRYGNAAFVVFTDDNGELFNTVCSQRVILPKLAAIADSLPIQAHVVKKEGGQFGKYWDLE